MNNIAIIFNQKTRNINQIKKLDINLINLEEFDNYTDIDFSISHKIIDLSVLPTKNKLQLFENISNQNDIKDFTTDLSFNYIKGIDFIKNKINAVTAFNIYSPKNSYIYYGISESIEKVAKELELNILSTSLVDDLNIYPITISTIINEAYLSLEENLASKEDIDNAMKFGLNYPLGPFEWSEKIGCLNIKNLLDEYFQNTKNKRYFSSTLLEE